MYKLNPEVKKTNIERAITALESGETGSVALSPIMEDASLWMTAYGSFEIVEGLKKGGSVIFRGDKKEITDYLLKKSKEAGPGEVPEVEIKNKKIKLGKRWYDLIMCYLCPICKKPIIAYWKVPFKNDRTDAGTVGRALRDSGFGGYRFFETKEGQGFEYDSDKDPRKRHQHAKEKLYGYYRGGETEYEILWIPFIKLNPLFNLNNFFKRTLDLYDDTFPKTHQFIIDQSKAVNIFIKRMNKFQDTFKIAEDTIKHGKPLFYFNLVTWTNKTRYSGTDIPDRLKELAEWFGEDNMSMINVKSEFATEEE